MLANIVLLLATPTPVRVKIFTCLSKVIFGKPNIHQTKFWFGEHQFRVSMVGLPDINLEFKSALRPQCLCLLNFTLFPVFCCPHRPPTGAVPLLQLLKGLFMLPVGLKPHGADLTRLPWEDFKTSVFIF